MSDRRPELIFSGKVASPGLAAGSIRLHARPKIDGEPGRLSRGGGGAACGRSGGGRCAAAGSRRRCGVGELAADAAGEAAAILEFQIALIEDGELIDPVRLAIGEGVSAAAAWRQVLDRQVAEYESAEDDYFRARSADLADLRDRVPGASGRQRRGGHRLWRRARGKSMSPMIWHPPASWRSTGRAIAAARCSRAAPTAMWRSWPGHGACRC